MKGLDNYFDNQLRRHDDRISGDEPIYERMEEALSYIGYEGWMINVIDLGRQFDQWQRQANSFDALTPSEWIERQHRRGEFKEELNKHLYDKYYSKYLNNKPLV